MAQVARKSRISFYGREPRSLESAATSSTAISIRPLMLIRTLQKKAGPWLLSAPSRAGDGLSFRSRSRTIRSIPSRPSVLSTFVPDQPHQFIALRANDGHPEHNQRERDTQFPERSQSSPSINGERTDSDRRGIVAE